MSRPALADGDPVDENGASADRGRKPNLAAVGLIALSVTAVIALSSLFAQNDQAARIAHHARTLHSAEELIGVTSALRSRISLVLVLAEADSVELDTGDSVPAATSQVAEARSQLLTRANALSTLTEDPSILTEAALVGRSVEMVVERIDLGDIEAAGAAATDDLTTAVEALEDHLFEIRAESFSLLVAEEGSAGTLARAASLAIGLVVPAGAVFGLRVAGRRRQQRRELELALEYEREQSRIKDEMIGNLSHELRTPLTAIYGLALAMEDAGFDDQAFSAEMLDVIIGQSAELSRMVDDLLTAAKQDEGDLAFHVDEVDVVRETEEALAPFRTEVVRLSAPGVVIADRFRLRQVIRNLVSNALKHGGPRVVVDGAPRGDRYLLAVIDDGPGVSPEIRGRMFERFIHRGSAPLTTGSVGLGLSIARMLVQGMGGELRYRRIDGYTVFAFDLPLRLAGQPETEPPAVTPSVQSVG